LENFTDDQQRFVNTLIRYRKGRASFRIGARLYGIRTFQTDNTGEQNKEGAEYEVLRLDELIRDGENYHECARMLCAKRLVESGYLPPGDDIRSLAAHLDDYFEEPAKDGLAELESRSLTEKYDDRERPYFAILRKQLSLSGKTVLLVDDSTTGGSKMLDLAKALAAAGATVTDALVLFEPQGKGARERLRSSNIQLHSIVDGPVGRF
jgi:hypothetical protein